MCRVISRHTVRLGGENSQEFALRVRLARDLLRLDAQPRRRDIGQDPTPMFGSRHRQNVFQGWGQKGLVALALRAGVSSTTGAIA
jgi:hypothetical protein